MGKVVIGYEVKSKALAEGGAGGSKQFLASST